jgi:hypothetical protein
MGMSRRVDFVLGWVVVGVGPRSTDAPQKMTVCTQWTANTDARLSHLAPPTGRNQPESRALQPHLTLPRQRISTRT